MASNWLRSSEDLKQRTTEPFVRSLYLREIGHYSGKGRHFNFLANSYYCLYPQTTPRYIIITNIGGKYKSVEMKFHENCQNGC